MQITLICQRCKKPFEARSRRARFCDGACFCANEAEQGARRRRLYSPARRRAAVLVQSAIYHKTLLRQPCEVCGHARVDAHHDDYAKPLDVRWLCRSHHKRHHDAMGKGLS